MGTTRTREVEEIRLYQTPEKVKAARLARVEFLGAGTAYISWHNLLVLRRQFRRQFKRDLPGVTDAYQGKVRTTLSWANFLHDASIKELWWVMSHFFNASRPDMIVPDMDGVETTVKLRLLD